MASLQDRQEGIIVKLFDLVHEADSYQPPELSVGDRILKGKFKNSPAEITGFTKDKHNQPVLKTNRGEVQLFKPRVAKLMDKDVAESLDNPYPRNWNHNPDNDWRQDPDDSTEAYAKATLNDGTELAIRFQKDDGDRNEPGDWSVEFARNHSQEVTGEGDEKRIFATVLVAIQEFVTWYKPDTVTFSASKDPKPPQLDSPAGTKVNPQSRAKLYNRMVQRYAGAAGYSAQQREGNDKITYLLRRAKPSVVEGQGEQDYLSQVPNLTWKPVSRSVWNTIQDEGLDEEQDAPKHTDWIMASLIISSEDARALQAFDSDVIEDFNRFDIHLKSRHPGLTDLIDYDNGTVTIVKPSQMQGVVEGLIDYAQRKLGLKWGKIGDVVNGSVVAKYLDSQDDSMEPARYINSKFKLINITANEAEKYREISDLTGWPSDTPLEKVKGWGIDDYKMDRIRKNDVTYQSLMKHTPVVSHRGFIINGNHRIARALEMGIDPIPILKELPQGVVEDREYIPSGKKRITWNGIDLVVSIDGATVDIRAMSGDSQMAYVVFDRDGDTLVADDLAVEEQYKGQGIAKIMYNYVKELGFRVKRSSDQLVAGKKFWDKNKGAENNIWEQGEAEDLNEFTPDNGGEITERINQKSIQAGFKDHQKVMGGKFDLYADSDGRTLTVELHDPNADFWEEAAWARFEVKGLFFMKNLQSLKTWVEPQYRRMGLATTIYQYVQNLGNTIKPAVVRTDMGKAMWKGFKSKGVAEGLQNIEIQDDKSIVTISIGGKERFVLQLATGHKLKSYGGRAYKYWTIWDRERKKYRFDPNNGMPSKNQAIAYVKKIIKREEDAAKVKPGVAEGTEEVNPLTNAVISFYKPVVDQIEPGAVDDYVKQAKELLNQAPDPTIRSRMLEIFRKGQKDPMIQGGVITAIAAILTGGLLSSASRMGLSPAQTNILLQAVLNTVIPTIIARINNKSWRDTIKYTLASVGVGMTAAATLSEKRVTEGLSIDVPNEEWLQDKIDYAKSKGRDEWGAPFFGSTTAYARPNPQVSVVRLELLKGMRNEQNNVRKTDLEWLMATMEKTGKLPLTKRGEEYAPYVMVAYNGEAWVNEGNHRIMAAYRLGWKKMPIEIKYFDGGERVESGIMYPGKIGLGRPAANPVREAYTGPQLKWLKPGELRGSYTDQQMRDRGFNQTGTGKWFILLSRWNELIAKKGIQ